MMFKFLISAMLATLIIGCGSSSTDNKKEPTATTNLENTKFFNNPIAQKVQDFKVNNLVDEVQNLSTSNFLETYKKVHTLQLSGFPSLTSTFDLKTIQSKAMNRSQKIIYQDTTSLREESVCEIDGTVRKNVHIIARENLTADTYKTGDNTEYIYNYCDRGRVEYNGKITYHVNDFTQFDYTFGAVPLGVFDSRFNSMSMETNTQKVTLNGTIRYTSKAEYKPQPDGSLISLTQTYATVGDFTVKIYNKSTKETTKLTYSGTLEKKVYTKGNNTSNGATSVERNITGFTYRKTSDYFLLINNGTKSTSVNIYDNQSGVMNKNGELELRPIGYDYSNASTMTTPLHTIRQMRLADGTLRYILDLDTDWFPDADRKEGEPTHTLPPSDVDLMGDIVVIGFDTCPPTTKLRQNLNELGITYTYINMHATAKEWAIFNWFHVSGVPYMGIKGSFIGVAGYDKKGLSILLNRYGFKVDETLIKERRRKSISLKLNEWFETLQSKEAHTALAVAIDSPYLYQAAWVWKKSNQEEATLSALENCEELRSERVNKEGEKEIKSECKIYSVDNIKKGLK